MEIAGKIKTYIFENGIKQLYVAEKANMTVNQLNLALNGNRGLSIEEYIAICRVLDVPFEYFVDKQ